MFRYIRRHGTPLAGPIVVVALSLAATAPAHAQSTAPTAMHPAGSLGFHEFEAPIGGRWWLAGQRVGLDFGVGYQAEPAPSYPDDHVTSFAFSVGVPIVITSWDRVHFIFRPGVFHQSQQVQSTSPPEPFDTDSEETLRVTGELEVEAFLLDRFSVSASHGIGWSSFDPAFGGEERTSFGTLGREFTQIGFHVYLFGKR